VYIRRFRRSPCTAMMACAALATAAPAWAQNDAPAFDEPVIVVTGTGRVYAAPDQAVVSLGATFENTDAGEAQREVATVVRAAVSAIERLGIAAENVKTTSLSLSPVYAERSDSLAADGANRRRDGPRIVAYRASNIVEVTVKDLAMVGAVVDAGVGAGANEIRGISFDLSDELPHRIAALERAVDAATRKARAAAAAVGRRAAAPIEIRERGTTVPFRALDIAFARSEAAAPIQPGEIAIEATVDVTFSLVPGASSDTRD
jgi:uncharacterized protein YggE